MGPSLHQDVIHEINKFYRQGSWRDNLLQKFSADRISEQMEVGLAYGINRSATDKLVAREIAELIKGKEGGVLRVLELAGGPIVGVKPAIGAPWLSRLIKDKYGDRVDIEISEIRSNSFVSTIEERCIFCAHVLAVSNGKLQHGYLVDKLERVDQVDIFAGLSSKSEEPCVVLLGTTAHQELSQMLQAKGFDFSDCEKLYLYGYGSSSFEKEIFSLRRSDNFDFTEVSSYAENYDLIFARHIPPAVWDRGLDRDGWMLAIADRKLNPELGSLIIGTDYGSQQEIVGIRNLKGGAKFFSEVV